jgi:hypothetical protein
VSAGDRYEATLLNMIRQALRQSAELEERLEQAQERIAELESAQAPSPEGGTVPE